MSDVQGLKDEPQASSTRWLIPLAGLILMMLLGYAGYRAFGGKSGPTHHAQPKIALLPETAPPPPPPPPPEKKIEPEVKQDKPQPQEDAPKTPDKPPEDAPIKMEGAAGDGPSAFGAGNVTSEYKGGDVNTGGLGGGVNKMQFAFFSGQLQRHVQSSLARDSKIKLADYRVNVEVWIAPTGDLRVSLLSSTGDEKADEALRQALTQLPPMQNVPAGLPQPIRLRITNRMTG